MQDKKPGNRLEDIAKESSPGVLREVWDLLIENKRWWLAPIIVVLVLLGAFVVLSGTAAAPLIYTIF